MKGIVFVIVVLVLVVPCLVLAEDTGYSKEFVVSFDDYRVVYVDSNITKVYSLGKILGDATIIWEGTGSGMAYIDEGGVTKKVLDLGRNGTAMVVLSGSDAVVRLDDNALWHGRITVVVHDVYRISVRLSSTTLTLRPGSSAEITMSIRRVSGFDRYVTIQYYVSDGLRVGFTPRPPWYVGSQQVTLSIEASPSAYGSYTIDIWIAAYREPGMLPPSIPSWQVPTPSPTFDQSHWILAGELSLDLNNVGGENVDLHALAGSVGVSQITIVLLVLLVAIVIIAIGVRGRGR